jgi:hypothetical protein
MKSLRLITVSAFLSGALAAAGAGHAQTDGSATGGTGGSAAAGGTSASSLGLGATSTEEGQTSSSLGTGATATTAEGKAKSRTHLNDNPNKLIGQSRAQAMDKGTFSKSRTKTTVDKGEAVQSTTRTMSHVPGQKPEKSTSTVVTEIPQ